MLDFICWLVWHALIAAAIIAVLALGAKRLDT